MTRLAALCFALTATAALADLSIHNTLPSRVRVEVTQPNGKVEKRNLSDASPAASSTNFIFSPGPKKVPLAVFDDASEVAWKGEVGVDDVMVLVPDAKGLKAVFAGIYGGTEGQRAAVFMNATGKPLTLDLFGQNGLASHKGVKPGAAFDLKQAVKLDARESTFSVTAKLGDDEALELSGRVMPARYYVLYLNTTGQLKLLQAGTITPK
ncbi:MAG: hypothetical protein ACO1OB_30280 [Archangium sp.]